MRRRRAVETLGWLVGRVPPTAAEDVPILEETPRGVESSSESALSTPCLDATLPPLSTPPPLSPAAPTLTSLVFV